MTESRVNPPIYTDMDYDFIAFSFNGQNSYDDYGIYRVIKDRYTEDLQPPVQDQTTSVAGSDGAYFFSAQHKQKIFNIEIAFDKLKENKLQEMKKWLNSKVMADLWFSEAPYKVYCAKVTGTPVLKYIPFEENGERVYKGEGTIQFTAYWPYAHTPDYVGAEGEADGRLLSSYSSVFKTTHWDSKALLKKEEGDDKIIAGDGENLGDLPAPFILKAPQSIPLPDRDSVVLKVGELEITIPAAVTNTTDDAVTYTHHDSIEWDSKTGLVTAIISGKRKPIFATGNKVGGIPVGKSLVWGRKTAEDSAVKEEVTGKDKVSYTLKYHYWYY